MAISAPASQGPPQVTRCQNSRSFSTRDPGGLPAINAALIAPTEMPAIQSGSRCTSDNASFTPACATALKQQRDAFEGRPADAGVALARGSCCLLIGHGGDACAFHAATPWAGRGGEQFPLWRCCISRQ